MAHEDAIPLPIARAACVGLGVVGSGWAARLLHNGVDVRVFDPDPRAAERMDSVLENADRAWSALAGASHQRRGRLRVCTRLEDAVEGAEFVQESVPERLETKRSALAEIDGCASPEALIGSSTSGLLPTALQSRMRRPERFVVLHPFVPVYLLPLVEVVAGKQTDPSTVERAETLCGALGQKPLVVRKEIPAFVADRLMEALWREALWLVRDDVATAEEIDDAIRYGCGLRWAQMGTFQLYHLAGGDAGMRHFMAQFGPALEWPWSRLTDTPEMNEALVEKIAGQTDAQAAGRDVRALERLRDDNLVAILRALGGQSWGAGETVARHMAALEERAEKG